MNHVARLVLEKTFQVLVTFSEREGRILKKWNPCYSFRVEVATAL